MRKDKIFSIINEINTELALSNSPQQILDRALDMLARIMKIDVCWICLLDHGKGELVLVASLGLTDELKKELQAPKVGHSLNSQLVTGGKLIISDLSHDDRFDSSVFTKAGVASLVVVPLSTYHVQGILGVMSRIQKRFDRDTVSLLMVIGNLICTALDKANHRNSQGSQVSESVPGTEFNIKEFEKLVTLAEQYSEATRLAIKEAMVRAKEPDSEYQEIIEKLAEDMTGLTSIEEGSKSKDGVESSATEKAKADSVPGKAEITSVTRVEQPDGEISRIESEVINSFELHALQMMYFKVYHTSPTV